MEDEQQSPIHLGAHPMTHENSVGPVGNGTSTLGAFDPFL
jgi:hypothetical protein